MLKEVYDGVAWTEGEVKVAGRGFVSCWVAGLPENVDRANVRAMLGNRRLDVDYVGEPNAEGCRQINIVVPADAGSRPVRDFFVRWRPVNDDSQDSKSSPGPLPEGDG